MPKIFNVTSSNINDGQEIADWIYEKLVGLNLNPDDLDHGDLITEACKALGWESVPQDGGIDIEWDCEQMQSPTPQQVKQARIHAGLTQTQAAHLIYKKCRAWQQYEAGDRKMNAALWEFFLIKLRLR